jgi:predicted PurR-regulated permease PerM
MSLKEQVEFIYEGLEESLKNIKDIKNRIAYSEDNFVLMNYLTVIENILSNLTAEIKYADKNDKRILSTVNNLMPVIIYLSIMLVSYFKKKIDLETLERFLIKIEMDIYRLGYTEFVTFYGIKE